LGCIPNGMQLLFCGSNFYQETFPTGIIALQIIDKQLYMP